MYIPFSYSNYNTNSYGIIRSNVQGYDLAEATTIGFIDFKDGTGDLTVLKSDNSTYFTKY